MRRSTIVIFAFFIFIATGLLGTLFTASSALPFYFAGRNIPGGLLAGLSTFVLALFFLYLSHFTLSINLSLGLPDREGHGAPSAFKWLDISVLICSITVIPGMLGVTRMFGPLAGLISLPAITVLVCLLVRIGLSLFWPDQIFLKSDEMFCPARGGCLAKAGTVVQFHHLNKRIKSLTLARDYTHPDWNMVFRAGTEIAFAKHANVPIRFTLREPWTGKAGYVLAPDKEILKWDNQEFRKIVLNQEFVDPKLDITIPAGIPVYFNSDRSIASIGEPDK